MRTGRIGQVIDRSRVFRGNALLFVAAIAAPLLIACSHSSTAPPSPNDAASGAGTRPPGGAPWSGAALRGNSTEALRAYLNSVEEIKPKRFEVQWSSATIAIDKAAALRSLRAVSRDGATFTFASAEPALARLQPGTTVWPRMLCLVLGKLRGGLAKLVIGRPWAAEKHSQSGASAVLLGRRLHP